MAKKDSEILEEYEQDAYDGHWGEDWLVTVGEGVKFYALECEAKGVRPTWRGLMRHIEKLGIPEKRTVTANDTP